jgi:hypothetical protein
LSRRTITYRLLSITSNKTVRKKVLQITTFMAVQAMRAVFSCPLRQKIILRTAPDLLTSTIVF